jgi:carboxyl-terminal processing protease
VAICNLFVDKNKLVVSTKGKIPEMDKEYRTTGNVWNKDVPVTVLVNHSSASASEIVSGTIQDMDRGVIIGERSYGKGLVQVVRNVGYNSRLKITISRYYTPSGRCIQAKDYLHRNPDGSVGYIPDSLKKPYKTAGGRTVLSGGGIEPDIIIKDEPMSMLASTLYSNNLLFDYATVYAGKHKTIDPANAFTLTDGEFTDFTKWLDSKEYEYKSETEEELDTLQAIAQREKYYTDAAKEFEALKTKLSHDKKQDMIKNKDQIKYLLENEIASRYYYMGGRIAQSLLHDRELDKAIAILGDAAQYSALLQQKK